MKKATKPINKARKFNVEHSLENSFPSLYYNPCGDLSNSGS